MQVVRELTADHSAAWLFATVAVRGFWSTARMYLAAHTHLSIERIRVQTGRPQIALQPQGGTPAESTPGHEVRLFVIKNEHNLSAVESGSEAKSRKRAA
jgi:hypothetical protein